MIGLPQRNSRWVIGVLLFSTSLIAAESHRPKTDAEWDRYIREKTTEYFTKLPLPVQMLSLALLREAKNVLEKREDRLNREKVLGPFALASPEELETFLKSVPETEESRKIIENFLAAKALSDSELEAKVQTGHASIEQETEFFSRLKRLGLLELSDVIGIRPGNLLKVARTIVSDDPAAYQVAQSIAGFQRANEDASFVPEQYRADAAKGLEQISLRRMEKLDEALKAQLAKAELPEQKKLLARLSNAVDYQLAVLRHSDFSPATGNPERDWAIRPNLIQAGHVNEDVKKRTDRDINLIFTRCGLAPEPCERETAEANEARARMNRLFKEDRASFGFDRAALAIEIAQQNMAPGAIKFYSEDPVGRTVYEQARNWAHFIGQPEKQLLVANGLMAYGEINRAHGSNEIARSLGVNENGPIRLRMPQNNTAEMKGFPVDLLRSLTPVSQADYHAALPNVKKDHPEEIRAFYELVRGYEYDPQTGKYSSAAKQYARDIGMDLLTSYVGAHLQSFKSILDEKDPARREELKAQYVSWIEDEINTWSGWKDMLVKPGSEKGDSGIAALFDLRRNLDDYVLMASDVSQLFPRVKPDRNKDITKVAQAVAQSGKMQIGLALLATGTKEPVLTAPATTVPKSKAVDEELINPPPVTPRTLAERREKQTAALTIPAEIIPTPSPDPVPVVTPVSTPVVRNNPQPTYQRPVYSSRPFRLFRRR